jgi:acid phosphatase
VFRRMLGPALIILVATSVAVSSSALGSSSARKDADQLSKINHIVVIYEENHSFDNLYGGWEGVNGIGGPGYAAHSTQRDIGGTAYTCIPQLDVNLTVPPLTKVCSGTMRAGNPIGPTPFDSHFTNGPFKIDDFIAATDKTCPPPSVFAPNGVLKNSAGALEGGCTRDIVHRFYQEQFQFDGGAQDHYALGSDAGDLTMGYYDTQSLPIYQYLHQDGHPHYAIEDNFFQGAFGGSFLNHQYLISATAPAYTGAVPANLRSILDSNGFPNAGYPLYTPTCATQPCTVSDQAVTATCPVPRGMLCGDYAVNTIQPNSWPYSSPGSAKLPLLTTNNIGDELTKANVSWAWYSGGWSNAVGDVGGPGWTNGTNGSSCTDPNHSTSNSTYPRCPDFLFQYHHQPFNYFREYAVDSSFKPFDAAGRAHLQDEQAFIDAASASKGNNCQIPAVSFVKPLGEENEHPGYTSEARGSNHLVDDLIKPIEDGGCAKDTMIIVTYDEFGGQWDHVAPPGQGNTNGPHDQFGPGTRIPTLVISPRLKGNFVVDSAEHDTASILATIEDRFGVAPINGNDGRDAKVNDLATVYDAHQVDDD